VWSYKIKQFIGDYRMKWLNKLKCKLGFHDNDAIGEDLRFMPHVKILLGACRRCSEPHNFFLFFKSKIVVSENSGVERWLSGRYCVMPLEEE